MRTLEEKWHREGSHRSVSGSSRLVWLQTRKKWWVGALLHEESWCFAWRPLWKSHANLN